MTNFSAEGLYWAIVAYKQRNDGNAPSLRDLMDVTGIRSTSNVAYLLQKLVALGAIQLDGDKARTIRVIGATWTPPASSPFSHEEDDWDGDSADQLALTRERAW